MDTEKLVDFIQEQFIKNNEEFFSCAWREKIEEFLDEESRFLKLLDWIKKEIKINQSSINILNPADKDGSYQIRFFKHYKEACKNIAMLLNLQCILLDSRCTTKMRENIEYAICKEFNINFIEGLNHYQ